MVESLAGVPKIIERIGTNLAKDPPHYRRPTPEDRSRQMQFRAFGEYATCVSEVEYDELIGFVRQIRPWLKEKGRKGCDHPDFGNRPDYEIFWLKNDSGSDSLYLSVEPKPWDGQSGRYLEPYPKFSIEWKSPTCEILFELNFNDTYYLSIGSKSGGVRFVSTGLKRSEMTKPEHRLVKSLIHEAARRFEIPLD